MNDYITVSFSGGKDSTAMLLHMLELGEHIDEVVCCDTGLEFPAMYDHIERVKNVVEEAGVKFTVLKAENTFEYYLLYYPVKGRGGNQDRFGYSWSGPRNRWCTSRLKTDVINRYFRQLSKHYNVIHCIGLAVDEYKRLSNKNNLNDNHRHPLVEWGWTEAECLQYCYQKGYDWGGLYEIFKRVSCWCCPLQSLDDLRKLRHYFPDLWNQLRLWDKQTWLQFRADYSVEQLEVRFSYEDLQYSIFDRWAEPTMKGD